MDAVCCDAKVLGADIVIVVSEIYGCRLWRSRENFRIFDFWCNGKTTLHRIKAICAGI